MSVVLEDAVSPSFEPEGSGEPSGLACLVSVARHYGLVLSVPQLIHQNLLSKQEISPAQLMSCADLAGMRAEAITLTWDELAKLDKALPAIVRLKNGSYAVLLEVQEKNDVQTVVLQEPTNDDALLTFDLHRFHTVWDGNVILIRRRYELRDEKQHFDFGFVKSLVFRERRTVRDIAICAFVLGAIALSPILFWRVMFSGVYDKSYNTLYVVCLAFAVIVVFEAVIFYLRHWLIVQLSERIDVKLSRYVFDKILNLPIDFFERVPVGMVTQRVYYLRQLHGFLEGQLLGTLLDSVAFMFFIPVLFWASPIAASVVFAICALIVVLLLKSLPGLRLKSKRVFSAEQDRGTFLVETLFGIRTIKSLVLETRRRQQWDVHCAQVAKAYAAQQGYANVIGTIVRPLSDLAVNGGLALAVFLVMMSANHADTQTLFIFVILTRWSVAPLLSIAHSVEAFDEARARIEDIGEVVNLPEEEGRTGHGVRTQFRGEVQFWNVTFKYPGAASPALQGISFEAPAGTTLGIVGRSGSGKSTLTRLLQGLHSSYDGLIKIDGIDLREYDIDHLRANLGVVLQENFLFNGTIRENITAAKTAASYDEVVRAARLAGAEEFIDRLPKGYETVVQEGSSNLSGGQLQRIAIARALITDPRVMLLDEATSALDPESEAIVNANLARLAHGRTLIVVSHRLSSLVKSDAILVLEKGRLEDIGRHEELLERCAIYRDLWNQQNRHLAPAASRWAVKHGSPTLVS